MALLSKYVRKKRIQYSVKGISKEAKTLEVGCTEGCPNAICNKPIRLAQYMRQTAGRNS